MKKTMKIFSFMLVICILTGTIGIYADIPTNNIQITFNGKLIEFKEGMGYPLIDSQNRTQIPVRVVSETMGFKVDWDNTKKQVTVTGNGTTVVLKVNSNKAVVNGKTIEFDTEAFLKMPEGRVYVPLRFVSESLGAKVDWKLVNRVNTIAITSISTTATTTTVGAITGFVQLDQKKVTGEQVVSNINTLTTAVPANTVNVKVEGGGLAILSYNPKSNPNNTAISMLDVISSISNDYEVMINPITWPVDDLKNNEYCINVANYTKEILKKYFPTKYEEVYKIMDNAFTGKENVMKTVYKFDNRELIVKVNGMSISYFGGNVKSITPIN